MVRNPLCRFFVLSGISCGIISTAFSAADKTISQIFEPGGVSINFTEKAITENTESAGENLIPNSDFSKTDPKTLLPLNWYSRFHLHDSTKEELRKSIEPSTTRKLITEDGKTAILLTTPEDAFKMRGGKKPLMSNYFTCQVTLPEQTENTKYQLSFDYKGSFLPVADDNILNVTVGFMDQNKKELKSPELHSLAESPAWSQRSIKFIAPKDTKFLSFYFRLYGCGDLVFRDIKLNQAVADAGVIPRLLPFSFLDNTFCLAAGKQGILSFSCKNEKELKINNPFLFLELPDGVTPLDLRTPIKIQEKTDIEVDGKKHIRYKINIASEKQSFMRDKFATWNAISVLVETSLPAGGTYKGAYWYEDEAYKTDKMDFTVKIIAGVPAKTPAIFETGAVISRDFDYKDPAAVKKLADFYKGTGFNVIHGGFSPENAKEFFARNIKIYNQPFYLCNGYRLGNAPKPEEVKFRYQDGTAYKEGNAEAICPVEVYTEGKYFKESVMKIVSDILIKDKRASSIMPNWEPYMFDFKGCFCDNCKKEFIKYTKLPEAEINAAWPKDIILKYRDIWIKFRSWQHGRLVSTLEKNINALDKNAHFSPEIAWSFLTENGNKDCAQYNPVDFIDELPLLEPWGPYIFYDFSKPYVYNAGIHLITFEAAKDIKKFVAEKVKDKNKQPKLIAFPHGVQCDTWVTEPEALAFDTLCFFLNGWEGSIAYYFPKGYDARYWNTMAKTNSIIADYENYVLKGKRLDSFKVIPLTPLPSCNIPKYWSEGGDFGAKLPSLKKNPLLVQGAEYDFDGKRLIALGNFWQKGETFVRLSVNGLKDGERYVLRQPDLKIAYAGNSDKIDLSAKELQDGITVHIGALRFAFFIVEPYKAGTDYGTPVKTDDMKKLMNSRLPEIKKAMDFESKYLTDMKKKDSEENPTQDYAAVIRELKNEKISSKAENDSNGNTVIAIKTETAKILIDPANGGRISSWDLSGTEMVSADPQLGLALDSFWWPKDAAGIVRGNYLIEKQELTPEAIIITLKRKLTLEDSKDLTGATILKTCKISASGEKIEISSEITNSTAKEKSFSFRYHDMLSFLEARDNKSGFAEISQDNKKQRFERIFTFKLFRFAKTEDKELEKAFPPDNLGFISSSKVEFGAPWTKTKLEFDVLNPTDLYGLIFWDSGKQKCSTFEPLFKRVTLKPGEKTSFGFSLQGRK